MAVKTIGQISRYTLQTEQSFFPIVDRIKVLERDGRRDKVVLGKDCESSDLVRSIFDLEVWKGNIQVVLLPVPTIRCMHRLKGQGRRRISGDTMGHFDT